LICKFVAIVKNREIIKGGWQLAHLGKGQNESLPFYSPKPKLSFFIYASTTPHVAPCMAFPKECLFIYEL
jgi:hypothetical protein